MLTKSKYLIGLQCPKYLWTIQHKPEEIPKASIEDEFKFKQGEEVGVLATKLYKGTDLSNLDFKENLKKTKQALKENKPIFEAGILIDNLFSRADILEPINNEWDIIEVKSGTKVKETNIHDVSFQKFCYESAGLKIRKCFLMHINPEYKRKKRIKFKRIIHKTRYYKRSRRTNARY